MGLSFRSAKDLRSRAELLPAGPQWYCEKFSIPGYATKKPIYLFYRNPLDCVKFLFANPIFANHIDFAPRKEWTSADRSTRVYSEWMTSQSAWDMQVRTKILSSLCLETDLCVPDAITSRFYTSRRRVIFR